MNKIIKDACILFAITLIAGVLLGIVYDVTKAPIAAQNEKAKQEAYKAVMENADSFEEIAGLKVSEAAAAVSSASEDFLADEITEVVAGVKDGKITGFVITVVAGDGYAGDIKFSVGIKADGTYTGTSILSIGETAGLGMRAKTDPAFLGQLENKKVEQFNLVKDGTGSSADDKVDAISGSTVTSKAIVKGVNAALAYYSSSLQNVKTVGGAQVE
ncbi:MAG: RnfABCDGE type electron transport complex subunit G [Eubacteriales bacterium]|nr:RnfABCDGE type electron transport complex subunit G [Eubacteriales bacterium]